MDRQIVYPGAIPLETDLLNTNKNAMVGLSKLAAAILGTATMLNGFAVTPTGPASLQVYCAPGEIYALANIDGTAYSSLAADTTHSILKQGISLDQVTLSCPAPGTAGQSINYLIEVAYQDTDANAVVLPYYNASNPSQAYSGPANAGTTQNTVRKGVASIIAKAGVAAATGTQTTPAPDTGYTGIYVVTVANGQTQITAPNIVAYAGAPFINSTILGLNPAFSVSPTAPTPAQFDNSTKAATTAFIANMGLIFKPAAQSISSNITVPISMAGGWYEVQSAGWTATLPPLASTASGLTTYTFKGGASGVTLKGNGAELIIPSTLAGGGANTYTVLPGESLTVISNGPGTFWYVMLDGFGANSFAASLASNGYQKLPGGLIVQWGPTAVGNSAADVVTTLPIAFTTQFLQVTVTQAYAAGSGVIGYAAATPTTLSTFTWRSNNTGNGFNFIAIGK